LIKVCMVLNLFLFFSSPLLSAKPEHDRSFWKAIVKNQFAVPKGESADALAQELSSLLGSPDAELRDDLAYSILSDWVYRRDLLSNSTLLALTDTWRANLKDGLGETNTDSVLKRSFSALCLSLMATREAKAPFMGSERYHQLVAEAVKYLQAERDLRGYDAKLHWIHATAHTADLLAALAGSSQLTAPEQVEILDAISSRLATASEMYTQGEQDRLAAAVVEIILRTDFVSTHFESWLIGLQSQDRDVWTQTTPAALARYQNHGYFLHALFVRLVLAPDSARTAQFKQKVLAVLKGRLD
jgi:hypothetical protein